MPGGSEVRPQKWANVIDLCDDGSYSAIWETTKETALDRLEFAGM